MDYEKKYKEALQRAKHALDCDKNGLVNTDKPLIMSLFPELKESEDERIRKSMHIYLDWLDGRKDYVPKGEYSIKDMLAWLEKQGKTFTKKDVDDAYLKGVTNAKNEIEKQYEATYQIRKDIATFIFNYRGDIKDRAKWMNYLGIKVSFVEKQGERETLCDKCRKEHSSHSCQDITELGRCTLEKQKVVPKFKVGDWIVCEGLTTAKIKKIDGDYYKIEFINGNKGLPQIDYIDRNFRLWTIEDAKDGDVLMSQYNNPFIYDGYRKYSNVGSYGGILPGNKFNVPSENYPWTGDVNIQPATKEQRDYLFQKMKEDGYEWDKEKKELKKID